MVNRVKLARIEKSLTQAQLAERVDVTRQTIGLIEKGKYNPTLQLCVAIAKALDKTLDDLFWEDDQVYRQRSRIGDLYRLCSFPLSLVRHGVHRHR